MLLNKKSANESGTIGKRPLAGKNRTASTAAHEGNQVVPVADRSSPKEQASTDSAVRLERALPQEDSNESLVNNTDGKACTAERTSTAVSSPALQQRKKCKPDAQALRLQEQLLRQAFNTAPPALKVSPLSACVRMATPHSVF